MNTTIIYAHRAHSPVFNLRRFIDRLVGFFCLFYNWCGVRNLRHLFRSNDCRSFLQKGVLLQLSWGGCSTEELWNFCVLSFSPSVSFPFTIGRIWASRMTHEWRVEGVYKIRSQCQGLVCYHVACFQFCVGRWWICPRLFEMKTPHGESLLKSVR